MTQQELIKQIINLEWKMMISITATDDPEGCMEDPTTFQIMRASQHLIWKEDTLSSYLADLQAAQSQNINMMAERYAHMMKDTNRSEYEQIKDNLQPITAEAMQLVGEIMVVFSSWTTELDTSYANIRSMGRPTTENDSYTSVDTYLRGELYTYSVKTLSLCLRDIQKAKARGINLSEAILLNMARYYGFDSLDEMEKVITKE